MKPVVVDGIHICEGCEDEIVQAGKTYCPNCECKFALRRIQQDRAALRKPSPKKASSALFWVLGIAAVIALTGGYAAYQLVESLW